MKHVPVGLLCILSAACGGLDFPGVGGSSSSSGEPPKDLTPAEAYEAYLKAGCEFDERCSNARGRTYTTPAACEASNATLDSIYQAVLEESFYEILAEGYRVADQARARECLASLATRVCTDPAARDPLCENLLVPVTAQATGQPCVSDTQFCANGSFCEDQEDRPRCSLCKTWKASGTACESGNECESGFCSFGTNRTCSAPAFKLRGQTCTDTDECLGSLQCAGSTGSKTCQERGGLNALCEPANAERPPCMEDLECVTDADGRNGVCSARLADGQPCRRRGVNQRVTSAPCAGMCTFTNPSDTMGTCGVPAAPPAAGSPCNGFQSTSSLICSLDTDVLNLFPDIDFTFTGGALNITACTCRVPVANGQACWFSTACQQGICTGANPQTEVQGTCSPRLANGVDCNDDDDCDSGYCTDDTGRCATTPSCP